jgi:hypothetical protein
VYGVKMVAIEQQDRLKKAGVAIVVVLAGVMTARFEPAGRALAENVPNGKSYPKEHCGIGDNCGRDREDKTDIKPPKTECKHNQRDRDEKRFEDYAGAFQLCLLFSGQLKPSRGLALPTFETSH